MSIIGIDHIESDIRILANAINPINTVDTHNSYLKKICKKLLDDGCFEVLQKHISSIMEEKQLETGMQISSFIDYFHKRYKYNPYVEDPCKRKIQERKFRWPLLLVLLPILSKVWNIIGLNIVNELNNYNPQKHYAIRHTLKNERVVRTIGQYESFYRSHVGEEWNSHIRQLEEFFFRRAFRNIVLPRIISVKNNVPYIDAIIDFFDSVKNNSYMSACKYFNSVEDIQKWNSKNLAQYIYRQEKDQEGLLYKYSCIYFLLITNELIKERDKQIEIIKWHLRKYAPSSSKKIFELFEHNKYNLVTDETMNTYVHVYHKDKCKSMAKSIILKEAQDIDQILNCYNDDKYQPHDSTIENSTLSPQIAPQDNDIPYIDKTPQYIDKEFIETFCRAFANKCNPNKPEAIRHFFWHYTSDTDDELPVNIEWTSTIVLFLAFIHYLYPLALPKGTRDKVMKYFTKKSAPLDIGKRSKKKYEKNIKEVERQIKMAKE